MSLSKVVTVQWEGMLAGKIQPQINHALWAKEGKIHIDFLLLVSLPSYALFKDD